MPPDETRGDLTPDAKGPESSRTDSGDAKSPDPDPIAMVDDGIALANAILATWLRDSPSPIPSSWSPATLSLVRSVLTWQEPAGSRGEHLERDRQHQRVCVVVGALAGTAVSLVRAAELAGLQLDPNRFASPYDLEWLEARLWPDDLR